MTLTFEPNRDGIDWTLDLTDPDEVASGKDFIDATCRSLSSHWFLADLLAGAGYSVQSVTRLHLPVLHVWLVNVCRGTSTTPHDAGAIERELAMLFVRNDITIREDSPMVRLDGERITVALHWPQGRPGKLTLGENREWKEQPFHTCEEVDAAVDAVDMAALEYHLEDGLERRVNHIVRLIQAQPPF